MAANFLKKFAPLNAALRKSFCTPPRMAGGAAALEQEVFAHSTESASHTVDKMDRFILVWSGKFKRFSDVPKAVSTHTMVRAKESARIKANITMIFMTLIACGFMMYAGRRAAYRGESVAKINEEWHRKINAETDAKK